MFKFKASDLPEILTRWSARYSVFVPSGSPDNAQMRIWSRRTRKEVRFMEPDEYTNLIVAPKGFVFGEREELFRWEGNEKTCTAISAPSSSSLQEEDKILFGLRPCDTYGLAYMDRFFLGEHHDINYHLRRQHVFIVAVNCLEAGPECYCASMGTGPFAEITKRNMQMFEAATKAFKPGAAAGAAEPAAPAATAAAGKDEDVAALKAELARLQEKIEKLGH